MDRIDVCRPALIAGALVLAACGGSESAPAPRAEPLIRDSAGVRTVVSYEARWAVGEGWRVSAEPVLRIGVVEGAEAYLFDRIAGMTRLSDGTLVVLDAGSTQLRYYSPAGEHVRSVGRRGQGPGEMRAPRWLERLPGDVVQVTHTDGRMRYGPDGTQVRDDRLTWDRIHEVGRRAAPEGAAGFLMESCAVDTPLFLGDDVLLCGSTYTDVRYLPDTPGLHRSVSLVAHADWVFETVDTIGIFHTGSLIRYRASGRLYSARISPPYGPRGQMRVSGSPPRFLYVDVREYRVLQHAIDGSGRILVMERVGGLRAPTAIEAQSFDRAFRGEYPGDPSRRMHSPGDPDAFRDHVTPVDSVSIIANAPHLDALGATWVPLDAPDDAEQRMHDIFDSEGFYLGQVGLPRDHFRVHEIGADYILGLETDDLGVQYVAIYRLDRSAPSGPAPERTPR